MKRPSAFKVAGLGLLALIISTAVSNIASAQVCGYYYRKNITIHGSRISGGPHANFPVLVSHTDAALATAAGKVTSTNGYDIVFSDVSGNALDFQLEFYDGATGRYIAWVKVPSITSGTDVTIQMHYGNTAVTTDQSTTNTWSSGYYGIWHFNNNVSDNSGNGLTSTNNGSTNTNSGKIGRARNFVDPNHWVELPTFGNRTTNFTISGWIYCNDVTRTGQRIFADDANDTGGYALSLGDGGTGTLRFYSRSSNPVSLDASGFTLNNNTWYHVAAVADITGAVKRIYINGVERTSGAYTNAWGTDGGNASIGGEVAGLEPGNRFHGNLDEIRVANRALSAGWLATEYNSHNQPTTTVGVATPGDFYTVGSEASYGNPAGFGNNVWNVYAYNGNNAADASNSYRGYYTHNTLSFNSTDLWGIASNPGAAAGYTGCTVNDDFHTVRYKRRGFTCGYYRIDIAGPGNISGHDDNANLYVDGAPVWNHAGCCDTHAGVWTGYLGPNSTVEFRWSENAGESYGRVTFTTLAHPTLSPPVTICAGSTTTLTASGAANYDWSANTTHLVAPYTNPSVVVSPPGATPNSTQTYTVRTTDATTGCTVSNGVLVTIDPLPTTAVTPTSATFCTSGSLDVTATGANTYTWSPMTGVTVTSPSGHTATLAPASTTTYTVTGSNNCASNTATVTVTVNTITGNPADFGSDVWNVYGYTGNNFDTYYGFYVHNTLNFDSRAVWDSNTSPSNAAGYTGCAIPNDNHSYRYKRRGFPCGFYQLDIPNHDDNVIIYIDGVNVFQQDSWFGNVYKANVWRGYLGPDTEIEYTIREFGGGSHAGLSFIYLYGPQNSAAQAVWNGETSTNWFTASNWCGSSPSATVGAAVPPGVSSMPVINGAGAQVLDLNIASGATLTVNTGQSLAAYGNWTNDGTFSPATGSSVVFSGSGAITLGGSSLTTFANVQINNSNANALTLASNMAVSGTFTFTNGDVITGANMVILNDNATAAGASNNSYVSGQVRKIGDDAFTFPVGGGGYYAPIGISAPNDPTYYFTAQYFKTDPDGAGYSASSLSGGIDHISRCEYWVLERNTAPSSNENVTLSWNTPRSCGIVNPGEIRVMGWNGTQWVNQGNGTDTGTASAGTETGSSATSFFGPFTFGSTTPTNPLPIELLSFEGEFKNKKVNLTWATASEINNDYFTIQKSLDARQWFVLGTKDGAGNSSQKLWYEFTDDQPVNGIQYYRLIQTDFDGTSVSSPIVSVKASVASQLVVVPNPARARAMVRLTTDEFPVRLRLVDAQGHVIKEMTTTQPDASLPLGDVKPGVYLIEATSSELTLRTKLMVK